ncbi:queuine tRNA-ribosyltransferase domain-containing protein [Ditylenchus destructor]|uniref:Queuine tRNA-ribosyltransferase catalytic subunit 1 n=1 Tax=Ditylenchus destructor TaxID=166010 RepID=A0AAD4N6C2_9BILA|nr:queuine tRNA-ribosyltransferase domain-containing protein [Ditylenchus destructor]
MDTNNCASSSDCAANETNKDMNFRILSTAGRVRHGVLNLTHGSVHTPVFMPVGTQGTMKGLTTEELSDEADCQILLSNTYHLGHRPGYETVKESGGLHKFMNWNRPILTDSGGFQMVSLSKLMNVTEDGVHFESPHTSEMILLTPEKCIEMQEALGSDIMMQLDHVIHSLTTGDIVEEAMERSIRWLDRCIKAQTRNDQVLFPIIQGGLNLDLRERCTKEMVERATVGIAIGGLSGGEEKDKFWRVVARCCELIPEGLPRYVMGVGWPVDLVLASLLGADMFDCVYPTRTARFGTAITRREGELKLNNRKYKDDMRPIDENCECSTCKGGYSRAFLSATITKETVTCHLISVHNIHHHLDLMRRLRTAVDEQKVEEFLHEFLREQYGNPEKFPAWVKNVVEFLGYSL